MAGTRIRVGKVVAAAVAVAAAVFAPAAGAGVLTFDLTGLRGGEHEADDELLRSLDPVPEPDLAADADGLAGIESLAGLQGRWDAPNANAAGDEPTGEPALPEPESLALAVVALVVGALAWHRGGARRR